MFAGVVTLGLFFVLYVVPFALHIQKIKDHF
jgi:hypothetical protein